MKKKNKKIISALLAVSLLMGVSEQAVLGQEQDAGIVTEDVQKEELQDTEVVTEQDIEEELQISLFFILTFVVSN